MPVLEELGVLPAVEAAGFPKKWGATMLWGTEPEPWSWYFKETNQTYPHAYQVWRPTFDKLLLDNARDCGVEVWEGHSVTAPLFDEDRMSGVAVRAADGMEIAVESQWVVDASGQSALVSRTLGLRQWDERFRNMAVYAYFRGVERLPHPDETNIFIESYEHGWAWNIPLSGDLASVGIVVDSEVGGEELSKRGVDEYFRQQIDAAPRTGSMLRNSDRIAGPRVVKDWSYASSRTVGDGWVLVGDAACFIDPLFSSGVHLAMMSGVLAAAYVHAVRSDSSMREPAAKVYQQMYRTEYSHFRELASLFYASNRTVESYFWEARRVLGAPESEEARQTFIRAVAGQAAHGYERAALERGDLPAEFVDDVRRIEFEQQSRRVKVEEKTILAAAPALAPGVLLDRRPVFADGEFRWNMSLISRERPEGLPVSPMVATLLTEIDGRRDTRQLIDHVTRSMDAGRHRDITAQAALEALRLLVVDGAVRV